MKVEPLRSCEGKLYYIAIMNGKSTKGIISDFPVTVMEKSAQYWPAANSNAQETFGHFQVKTLEEKRLQKIESTVLRRLVITGTYY